MKATLEDIDATFATAVRAPILLMQATVPHMPRYSRIVNVSSVASKMALGDMALYAGGKAAMDAITYAVSTEVSTLTCWTLECSTNICPNSLAKAAKILR